MSLLYFKRKHNYKISCIMFIGLLMIKYTLLREYYLLIIRFNSKILLFKMYSIIIMIKFKKLN